MRACNEEHLSKKLHDYFSGHLQESGRLAVEKHLEGCEHCRRLLETMKLLGQQSGEQVSAGPGGHISSDLLGRYFADRASLGSDEIEKIEVHLEECEECAYELRFLEGLSDELQRAAMSEAPKRSLVAVVVESLWVAVRKPALAYFLLLLAVYPAAMWLFDKLSLIHI